MKAARYPGYTGHAFREPARRGTVRAMGLLDRASRAVSANFNALLDKLEDPKKQIDLTVAEMEEHVRGARQEIVRSVASEIPAGWQGVRLESVHAHYTREVRPILIGVTVAAALVLGIVVVNIAVLMLFGAASAKGDRGARGTRCRAASDRPPALR